MIQENVRKRCTKQFKPPECSIWYIKAANSAFISGIFVNINWKFFFLRNNDCPLFKYPFHRIQTKWIYSELLKADVPFSLHCSPNSFQQGWWLRSEPDTDDGHGDWTTACQRGLSLCWLQVVPDFGSQSVPADNPDPHPWPCPDPSFGLVFPPPQVLAALFHPHLKLAFVSMVHAVAIWFQTSETLKSER